VRRSKPFRAMFVTADGKISLQPIRESPVRFAGFIRTFVRTGVDRKQNLFTYEEDRVPLASLPTFYQSDLLAAEFRRQREARKKQVLTSA
jgi:hypothetical protein